MSNYVNYVNVSSTSYALGPLMSTASGGIVDNTSGVYSDYNNCIIHGNIIGSNLSMVDSNAILNANVNIGDYGGCVNTAVIGGSVALSGDCSNNAFINCSNIYDGTIECADIYNNTFIGLYGYSVADTFSEDMLLSGVNNVVQGYAEYVNAAGFHATATKTLGSLYASVSLSTGIYFDPGAVYYCNFVLLGSSSAADCRIFVKNGMVSSCYDTEYYYYGSDKWIAPTQYGSSYALFTIRDNELYIYTYDDIPCAQLTISYDVVPAIGGGSSSSSGSY